MRLLFVCAFSVTFLSGCTLSFDWFHRIRARELIRAGDYPKALEILREVRDRNLDNQKSVEVSRLGARVAQIDAKDYILAIEFYRHLVMRSENVAERKNAQRLIAQLYFENLQDYSQAVLEYEKILKLTLPPEEAFRYRLNLAKAHFQLNSLEQADNEIDTLLAMKKLDADQIFDAKMLKANIQVAVKNLVAAAETWSQVLQEFPERSKREKVALNLVVCYEEQKEFGKAIEVLEKMKADYPNPDFLDVRIARLKERKINLPGAQGLRR